MLEKPYSNIPYRMRIYSVHILFWMLLLFFPIAEFIKGQGNISVTFVLKPLCALLFFT
jgi:hypothetical protein